MPIRTSQRKTRRPAKRDQFRSAWYLFLTVSFVVFAGYLVVIELVRTGAEVRSQAALASYATLPYHKVPVFCGGIAAMRCASGYNCILDGTYPDAGGRCILNKSVTPKFGKPTAP